MGEKQDRGLVQRDISIPEVENVHLVAVLEENEDFRSRDWNVYLINERKSPIETVLIVSRGYEGKKSTSTMRHSIQILPARSFAKVEFMQDEVLELTNEFSISFFAEGKMFHKKYFFQKNTLKESSLKDIPVMIHKGILAT